jgi:hypothetical protein
MKSHLFIAALILYLLHASVSVNGQSNNSNDPNAISGEDFNHLMGIQNVKLQIGLEKVFPESEGYLVTGPLCDTTYDDSTFIYSGPVRVICPDIELYENGLEIADGMSNITVINEYSEPNGSSYDFEKYYTYRDDGLIDTFRLQTINGVRYELVLNWVLVYSQLRSDVSRVPISEREEIADYFIQYDSGYIPEENPYASDVPYIIEGYQNYKDFLYSYAEIDLDFINGVTAFVPTDETLQWFRDNAPQEAYPNKEEAKFEEEIREFFERGGDLRVIQTLTKEGFDTLQAGEYFYAVSPTYKIRFGRELLREEVNRIEEETGKKVPRANHAFLFPGEAILTAGAFWIDIERENRLVKVNAQSGHYFYSNVSPTIREDISERSDHYLKTLGHFFKALDNMQIPYDNILISKLH